MIWQPVIRVFSSSRQYHGIRTAVSERSS